MPHMWKNGVSRETFIARGARTINDYIWLHNAVACMPASYGVREDIDVVNDADDHLPVGANVVVPAVTRVLTPGRRRVA
eukprot:882292-Karenia_brevis.AAC.1